MANQLTAYKAATEEEIVNRIYIIRGQKVMLDRDLAEMYGVEVRALNQAVKRNAERFPQDFMFQLTTPEFENWKSQLVISNSVKMGLRKSPYAFTEHGVLALSYVLRSGLAFEVGKQIIRVYVKMRQLLLDNKELWQKIEKIEQSLLKKDEEIAAIFNALKKLLIQEDKPRAPIGFMLPAKKKKK